MLKNRMTSAGSILIILVYCSSSWADFKYTQSSKLTGGSMASMMKVAGVFSKQARQARDATVSTEYVKGRKMRRDEGDAQTTIIDLDGRQIINIDNQKHTYSVMTFDQMRQMLEQQKAKMQEQMAKANKGQAQANLKITPKMSVSDGPGTRTILGLPTHEAKVDLEMLMEASDPNQPAQSGQVQTWVKSDQYLTPSLPGSEQVREFEQAMAKELDWMPGEMFGGNPQISMSMRELQKNAASVQGFPLLQYISMGMGVPGQAATAGASTSSGQQQPQEASSSPDLSNPSATAAKAVGKMLGGFHRKKKDQDQSSCGGSSASAAALPSQPGSLMEMTVEVTSYSTDSLADSLFAAPAGYSQVAPMLGQTETH